MFGAALVCVFVSSLSKMPQVPEVQLFAAYFPQWHQTPLNDYWFGPNFTDWALLCNRVRANGGINRFGRKTLLPLPPPNGLGWYDLNDQRIRRRQALLAREYGIHGFAYYHFWFTRPAAWGANLDDALNVNGTRYGADMDETLLKLLDEHDGEPNLPFYFVWANEAFVWKWVWPHGRVSMLRPGATQVPQNYERPGWKPHFRYLLRFFMHQNYHKVDGKPVFAIYEANQKRTNVQAALDEMMHLFQVWAVDAGLSLGFTCCNSITMTAAVHIPMPSTEHRSSGRGPTECKTSVVTGDSTPRAIIQNSTRCSQSPRGCRRMCPGTRDLSSTLTTRLV